MAIPVLRRVLLTGALTMLPLAFTAAAVTESATAAPPPAVATSAAQAPTHATPGPAHVVVDAHCQDAAHKAVDCARMKCMDHAGKPVAACAAGHASPAAHSGTGAAQAH